MAREDRLSRAVEKGLCGTPTAGGGRCDRIRGDCPYHAAGEARCSSCLDGAPDRQCSLMKEPGSDFCSCHREFPNLGRQLKQFAEECRQAGRRFTQQAFLAAHFPTATSTPSPNLYVLVGELLCLPPPTAQESQVPQQPRGQEEAPSESAARLGSNKPASWSTANRAERRHRLAVKRALENGDLTLDPVESPAKRLIVSLDAEVARRCELTETRRGVWGQAARQKTHAHISKEADRVVEEVGQRVVEELDRRFPSPQDDIEKMRDERRRLETAIRQKTAEKKAEREAEKARKAEARSAASRGRSRS